MNTSASLTFIALFNELDKYLEDTINDYDQHMSFNHKLKIISQGSYAVSHLITTYFYELNYLGELRNQFVHGLQFDGIDYIIPSDHAIKRLTALSDEIMKPLSCFSLYQKSVTTIHHTCTIQDAVNVMNTNHISFLPIVDGVTYYGTLNQRHILQHINTLDMLISEVELDDQSFVAWFSEKHSSIDVFDHFKKHPHSVIYLTKDGIESSNICGIVTEHDVMKLTHYS